MCKYLLLYNLETPSEKRHAKNFLEIMPEAKILNYGITGSLENDKEIENAYNSIWVPEDKFLLAWTFFNHRSLVNRQINFEDGQEYMDIQLADKSYHKLENEFN